jgi:hypothetical protein
MPSPTPLDDIAFLARSPHRVEVLDVLATDDATVQVSESYGLEEAATAHRALGKFSGKRSGQLARYGNVELLEHLSADHQIEPRLLSLQQLLSKPAFVRFIPIE